MYDNTNIKEGKVIIKEYPSINRAIGGIGRDITSNKLDYVILNKFNFHNNSIIPCKYCIEIDNELVEISYKSYDKLNEILSTKGNIPDDYRVRGRIRDIKDNVRIDDIVVFAAIPLHKLEIFFKDAKLNKNKMVLKGTVKYISNNLIGVETSTNNIVIDRFNIKLIEREGKQISDTFNVFNII